MRALLDVNVLIALLDAQHVAHTAARRWLTDHIAQGWASCPITQNGCVRILSQPSYPNSVPVSVAIARLRQASEQTHHKFFSDDLSLLSAEHFDHARLHTPRTLTDAYLLALAVKHMARLVTLDQGIALQSVRGAHVRHLVVI